MMDINFSIYDLFRYWDSLTQYVNPYSILLWGILGGVIGFVLMIILVIVYRKKILINRRHWTLKVLAYTYMIFLPLFAGFCFTQWSANHNCQSQLISNIPTYLGDANSAFNTYLKEEVEKVVKARYMELTSRDILSKVADVASTLASENLKSTETNIGNKISAYLIQTDYIKSKAVSMVAESIGEKLMMDKEMTEEMLDVKIQDILNNGVLNTYIEKHIRNIFGGLKMNVMLLFLLGLIIPLSEIILAHYLEKKRLTSLPVEEIPKKG